MTWAPGLVLEIARFGQYHDACIRYRWSFWHETLVSNPARSRVDGRRGDHDHLGAKSLHETLRGPSGTDAICFGLWTMGELRVGFGYRQLSRDACEALPA